MFVCVLYGNIPDLSRPLFQWPFEYISSKFQIFHVISIFHLPLATGDSINKFTQAAPVLWPINVTAPISPPNVPILSLTHCNAAIWSNKPKLLTVWSLVPGFKKPLKPILYSYIIILILSYVLLLYRFLGGGGVQGAEQRGNGNFWEWDNFTCKRHSDDRVANINNLKTTEKW